MSIVDIILSSGKSSVDIALYTLLPVMIVMFTIMKVLEDKGVMNLVVSWTSPLLKPFGLTGLSTFALIQINFISFAAPLATLSIMDKKGVSDRHLAATLGMVLAMGQGNILYPMVSLGLNWGVAIAVSITGGLAASAAIWYLLGRKLSGIETVASEEIIPATDNSKGIIGVVNEAGANAIKLAMGSIPMLTLSITIVGILKEVGVVSVIEYITTPFLVFFDISPEFIMPTVAKYLGGGTAYLVVASDLIRQGVIDTNQINTSAGFLIHAFDLPGIGIFLGISPRFLRVFKIAAFGAMFGIFIRSFFHLIIFNNV